MKRPVVGVLTIAGLAAFTVWAESPEQAQFDFANGLLQRGFHKEAVQEYKTYLEKYPQGEHVPIAYYRMGEAAYAAHDYSAALDAFDKVMAGNADPDTKKRAKLSRGEVLYCLKRPADALVAIEPLTTEETAPDLRARALYYLGKINADSGNGETAVRALKTLIETIPDNPLVPFAQYQLAFIYLSLKETEKAAVEFSAVAASKADNGLRMEARFRAGDAYEAIGWHSAALSTYEQLKKEFPDSPFVRKAEYGIAWASYHTGKYAEAAVTGEAFLKKYPDAPEKAGIEYLLGNCLQQQQRYEEAIEIYKKVRTEYPGTEFAGRSQYKQAWCLYLTGKMDEAKAEISAFLQSPGDLGLLGDASFLLGSIYVARGEFEQAYEEFRLVAEKYAGGEFGAEALYKAAECLAQLKRTGEAAKAFENFARQYPDNILAEQAMLRAGDAQFMTSAFAEAVERYKKILEAPGDASVELDTLYRLAITYHNMKDYAASADTFQKLLTKAPDGKNAAEAHFRIGDFLLHDGKDPVKAIESFNACLERDPKGPFAGRAAKGIALARYETKDFDAAMAMFLRLMTEFPNVTLNEETYAWTGQRLFDQEKWEQAQVAFEALLKANPNYPNPERVRLKMAECSEKAGKTDEALALYQSVVEADPRGAIGVDARYRMAQLFETIKKDEEAFRLYEEAANANTGDTAARARFRLGELYEAKQDFDAAARSYMRVAILFLHDQLSPESLWRAGQCFEKAGSREQARKSYEELVREYPESEQAAKAKTILEKMP